MAYAPTLTSALVGHLCYPPKPFGNVEPGKTQMTSAQVFNRDDAKQEISIQTIFNVPLNTTPGWYKFQVEVRPKGKDVTTGNPKPGINLWFVSAEKVGGQQQ